MGPNIVASILTYRDTRNRTITFTIHLTKIIDKCIDPPICEPQVRSCGSDTQGYSEQFSNDKELRVPLVKSDPELTSKNETLISQNKKLFDKNQQLTEQVTQLQEQMDLIIERHNQAGI